MSDLEDLIGKTPFCLGSEIFPWSDLEPYQVCLIVAATTDSQDLAKLVNVDESDEERMKVALKSAPSCKIPTVVLWRVFRCSNSIQNLVEYLQLECSKKDQQFGFAVDPRVQIRGHDVRGDPVEWIQCPQTEHMICSDECPECFLPLIASALTEKLETLEETEGIASSDINVIVNSISQKRATEDNRIKAFMKRSHPGVSVKLNFEMEGLEAPVVILIRNGQGPLGSAISLGVSRATTKLVIMSPDDNDIIEKAAGDNRIKKVKVVEDKRGVYDHVKIQKDSHKARKSCIGRVLQSPSLHDSLSAYLLNTVKDFFEVQARCVND